MSTRRLPALALSFALCCAVPFGAAAAPAPHRFSPDDLQRIVGLSSPQLSPDGTRVALVVTRIDEIEDKYVRELDLVDVRTHAVRVLTIARPELSDPAWSPTGDRLAFITKDGTTAVGGKDDDAHDQVFVLPMDGGDARPVTKAPAGVEQFAWRPDGRAIAYAAEDAEPKKTGAARFRDSFEVGNTPITALAMPKPVLLWTLDLDAKAVPRELTSDPVRSVATGEAQSTLSWSPDGSAIAFTLAPNAVLNDATRAHVAVVDVATAKLRLPTGGSDFESDPRFSPEGANLAYLHSTADSQITLAQTYVTSAKATSAPGMPVTAPYDRAVHDFAWTHDGAALWFTCDDGTAVALVRAPLAGAPQRIDLGGLSAVSPLDGAIGRDGAFAFVGTANAQPSELYYRPASGGAPIRLTAFNAATTALALGSSETIAFTAGNGMPSDAVLRLPPGFDPHRRYPLVLEIHGGPTAASTQTFDRLAQLMVARGWLVLEPNYRGSDDHGLAFQSAVRYDPEAGPGADILAAVAAVRARGIVDDARIAVSGWSYGGIMTAWLATHATIWHAAVSGASVNDWAVDYSIADDSESDAALFHATPWTADARAEYAAASAVNFAKNVTTPILLLSDTGDNRDPIATTYEFYHALRDNGKDVRFVAWPLAGHFPGDPVRTRDVYEHWVDFIAEHLR